MELIYLYIGDIGRQIKNQGFNFSNKYDVSYEAETKELTIKKKQNPIPKIYGDHIVNITALVGQNGVGKSTVLNLLGLKAEDIQREFQLINRNWFAIYEVQHNEDNERTFLFEGCNEKYIPNNIEKYLDIFGKNEHYADICCVKGIFCDEQGKFDLKKADSRMIKDYCSHIRYFYYGQSARTTQGKESLKDISGWFRNGIHRKYLSRCGSFRERVNLCYALLNQTEDDGMKVLREIFHTTSPEHLALTIKLPYAGLAGKANDVIEEKSKRLYSVLYNSDGDLWKINREKNTEDDDCYRFCILLLRSWLFHCLNSLNCLNSEEILTIPQKIGFKKKTENGMSTPEHVEYLLKFIISFQKLASSNDDIAEKVFQNIYKRHYEYQLEDIIILCVLLTGNDSYTAYIKDWLGEQYGSLMVHIEENMKKVNREALILAQDQIEVNETWVKFRIKGMPEKTKEVLLAIASQLDVLYNLGYGSTFDYHAIIETSLSDISTGELRFIDFFADLYEIFNKDIGASTVKDDIDNQTMILLFDEPDVSLHPEWARQFIYALNSILNIKPFAEKSINYQIILTTHSPIMLSDIPSEHIVCMARDKNDLNKINVRKADFGFASNIYDIMKSSFFMEKYFGEFASRFVEELADECAKLKTAILKEEFHAESKVYADKKRGFIDKIVLIGEPRLKRYYMNQIEQMDEFVFQNNKSKMDYKHLRSHLRSIYGDEELQKIAKILLDSGEDL